MTNAQKLQRIQRAKTRAQMRDYEEKCRIAYAEKKEELEKHYGYYVDPTDFCALDHRSDMKHWEWQDEMDAWKKFAERHVPEDEKVKDEYFIDEKAAWLAILSRQICIHTSIREIKDLTNIGEKYPSQDIDIDNAESIELYEKYERQISEMRRKMLTAYPPYCERPGRGQMFYKTKDGETLTTPKAIIETNKISARRLCFLIETCLKKGVLNNQCINYLQAIDSGKKVPEFKDKIDTKDLLLYSAMLDSLKIARITGGQDKGIAQRIESLGAKFLTAKDLKSLQKIRPQFDMQRILMMKKKFAENAV